MKSPYPLRRTVFDNDSITDIFKDKSFLEFNDLIGLPVKNSIALPIFDYELDIIKALSEHKRVWIKKSTGLGITELILRYIAWLCLKDDELSGTQMVIVTGPRIDLAIDLIDRLKGLFYDFTTFSTKETVLELNGVHNEAYPSHHLDSARGLPNVSFVLLEEADFFPKNQQQDARKVSERYIAKSNPWIVMVSTPNAPGMLFESIEKEKDCIYHRIQLHWTVGLNKIFTQQEIDEQKKSASFNQEYGLQYLGIEGNLWSNEQIQDVITLGEQHKDIPISNHTIKSIGIDWGFSSSATAIVMLEHVKDISKIIVRHTEIIEKGDPNAICDKMFDIHRKYWNTIFWCDGSNRAATNLLKIKFGESLDWDTKDVSPNNMKVVPVNFATEHKTMLSDLQVMVTNKYLAVPESHKELIIGMRTAYAKDLSLDKQQTSYDDLIDAIRLALKGFRIK